MRRLVFLFLGIMVLLCGMATSAQTTNAQAANVQASNIQPPEANAMRASGDEGVLRKRVELRF